MQGRAGQWDRTVREVDQAGQGDKTVREVVPEDDPGGWADQGSNRVQVVVSEDHRRGTGNRSRLSRTEVLRFHAAQEHSLGNPG